MMYDFCTFLIRESQKQPPEVLYKKGVLNNFTKFTGKLVPESLFLVCNFIKKETLAQVFSCEFCEIVKNTCFEEHLRKAASGEWLSGKGVVHNQDVCSSKRSF